MRVNTTAHFLLLSVVNLGYFGLTQRPLKYRDVSKNWIYRRITSEQSPKPVVGQ